jgi:nitroreductase
VTDADFPQDGPVEDQLAAMLNWAVHAPSVLNTQPWRFRVRGSEVGVYVDRARVLQTVDPDGREAVVSCGAALFTLRLAARHYGFAVRVAYPAPGADADLVATLQLAGPSRPTPTEEALFRAVKGRHTNRDPYADLPLPVGLLNLLRDAADAEGATLHVVAGEAERAAAADLVAEAVRQQGEDEATVAELRAWLRPTGDRRADGVPDEVQGGWDRLSYLHTEPRFLAAEAARLARDAPALLVVSTERDARPDWARAGQALQRVLLTAAGEGLAASYFNQPTEVPALRHRLGAVAGPGFAQVAFRVGTPVEAQGTPRRPVADVLRPDDV